MSKQDFIEKASFLEVRQSGKDAILSYNCKQTELFKVVELAKENGFDLLCDIASVDMGVESQNRFLCVYHFYSTSEKEYLRLAGICENNDKPSLPSISSLFGNADWFEREAYDMMGINFEGHPDLRRILMWDSYPSNPLRKDFPLAGKEVPTPEAYEDTVGDAPMKVVPAPMEGGPFHSPAGAKTSAEKEPRSFGKI